MARNCNRWQYKERTGELEKSEPVVNQGRWNVKAQSSGWLGRRSPQSYNKAHGPPYHSNFWIPPRRNPALLGHDAITNQSKWSSGTIFLYSAKPCYHLPPDVGRHLVDGGSSTVGERCAYHFPCTLLSASRSSQTNRGYQRLSDQRGKTDAPLSPQSAERLSDCGFHFTRRTSTLMGHVVYSILMKIL